MTIIVNCPSNDLDVPDVGAVLPGEVSNLGHAERHGADAEVKFLPVQSREQVLQVLVIIVKLNKIMNEKDYERSIKKEFSS